jgi:glycerol-3-phosphate dehydrogenase
MIPDLATTRFIRAYAGVRPLLGTEDGQDDRRLSRGFTLIDHAQSGVENFTTITGGKLTTYRRMAEKTADLVCAKLGISRPGVTRTAALPASPDCQWTVPGKAGRRWLKQHAADDLLLCECEMIPRSTIDALIDAIRGQGVPPGLRALGLRSRIGKGTCQGAFCGMRIAAHMYDQKEFVADQGLRDLKAFLKGRWKGIRPVLWDTALSQEELQEALHCGLFGMELD